MFDHEMRDAAERVLHACRKRRLKLVTAESCTGGLVAATLTAIAGSSDVVERAFVTYANEAKREMLGVPWDALLGYGAVSDPVELVSSWARTGKVPSEVDPIEALGELDGR